MTRMHHWDVETAPLVDADTKPDGLGRHGQHSRVVADKYDAASGRYGSFNDSNNIGDGKTTKERPHGEVLESGRRRGELVAQGVILHIDTHKVVQTRSREAEDARDLLGMEKVGSLVPVNPHAPKIVAEKVVQWVARQEG